MRRTIAITLFALAAVAFASTDSYGCWTCAPGWVHWYDLAWSAPSNGDKCQCVQSSSSVITTKAPTSAPSSCWTCPAGYVHWYDIAGMAQPSDPCACVVPSSSATTTKAPTSNCWTCPAGYAHWYDLGMTQPADPCACVATSAPVVIATTTKAPATPTTTTTTSTPTTTRNCWTCAAGWVHWYDIAGMAQPSDPCACVQSSSSVTTTTTTQSPAATTTTTTSTPTTTNNCWTCAAGWVHWYDIPGMAQPSDPCACVQSSSSVTTTTTTVAPAGTGKATSAPTTRLAQFLAYMTPSTDTTGSISFSPGIGSYSPSNPPPLSLVGTLMDNLISSTKYRTIMTYYIDSYTIGLAAQKGLKVLGIIYITPGQDNTALINTAITAAKTYPDTLISISCGNEMGANYGLVSSVVSAVSQCASMLRSAGVTQPIGVIDTYYSWCSQNEGSCNTPWTAVSQYVDWIGLNDYGFWDNLYSGVTPCNSPSSAPSTTLTKHKRIQTMYGKPTVLTESGWPSAPSGSSLYLSPNYITGQQCGPANAANQQTFIQTLINVYRAAGMPCNTFEAYQEPWKGTSNSDVNRYWGICQGVAPYTCVAPQ